MLSYNRELNVAAAQIFHPRNGIGNTLAKLNAGRPVTIAYFGGSITAAAGWRPKTLAWFRQRYPRSEITEVNAAIGGTGSFLGVFRCRQDVLKHDPDLIFIEFAVNDGDEAPEAIWRQMEGIIRQARAANPMVDICYVYTLHTKFVPEISGGMNPSAASADEMLAEHYGIPSINVALRIVQLHSENKLIYSRTTASDGTFLPTPPGVVLFSNDECHPTKRTKYMPI